MGKLNDFELALLKGVFLTYTHQNTGVDADLATMGYGEANHIEDREALYESVTEAFEKLEEMDLIEESPPYSGEYIPTDGGKTYLAYSIDSGVLAKVLEIVSKTEMAKNGDVGDVAVIECNSVEEAKDLMRRAIQAARGGKQPRPSEIKPSDN